jgi:hypothetical protein
MLDVEAENNKHDSIEENIKDCKTKYIAAGHAVIAC